MAEERGLSKEQINPTVTYTVTLPSQHFLLKLPSENQTLILIWNSISDDLSCRWLRREDCPRSKLPPLPSADTHTENQTLILILNSISDDLYPV
jgi:hypothetical protein